MVELLIVDVDAVRSVRRAVLETKAARGPTWPGDDDDRTLHFVIKEGRKAVAGASLAHEVRGELGSEVWRLRGPFVLAEKRRKGHGRRLAQAVQAVVERRGGGLWALVPLASLPFFSPLGFRAQADGGRGGDDLLLCWHAKP